MNRPPAVGDMDTRSDCSNTERLGGRRIFPMPFSLILYFSIHRSLWTTASSKELLSWSEDLVFKSNFSASFLLLFAPEFATLISAGCIFWSSISVCDAEFLIDFFLPLTFVFDLIFQSPIVMAQIRFQKMDKEGRGGSCPSSYDINHSVLYKGFMTQNREL
jgi:hypothetical protein